MPTRAANLANPDATALDRLGGLEHGFALAILNASPDCIKLIELDGSISFMSHNGLRAMELDGLDQVVGRLWTSLWPIGMRSELITALNKAKAGASSGFEGFCPTAKGAARWWEVSVSPIRGAGGVVECILSTSRDVTARVRHEETHQQISDAPAAKDLLCMQFQDLSQEMNHRIKNNLATVISLLRSQARGLNDGDAQRAVEQAANRIASLATLHDQLHLDPSQGTVALKAYLRLLLQEIGAAASGTLDLSCDTEDELALLPDQAVMIGVVLNELVGNGFKHGGRSVTVRIGLLSRANGRSLDIAVSDDGPGLPAGFSDNAFGGLGLRIVSGYVKKWEGQLQFDAGPSNGATVRLQLPVPQPMAGQS